MEAQATRRRQAAGILSVGESYFFFFATLRVFFAVFFTALFAFFAFLAFFAMLPSNVSEMAWFAACTRESRCTTSRIHQHVEKNSVPLKEVLTERAAIAQLASLARARRPSHDDAKSAVSVGIDIFKQCRKCPCRNGFFNSQILRATCLPHRRDALPTSEKRVARSLSRIFWQQKKICG